MYIDPSIFRAYDIRGISGHTLTSDATFLIGQSVGSLVQEHDENTVIIGRDGRLSSPILAMALVEGIHASGCNVIDIGAVPTPLLYFATHILAHHSGIMITGSHNPPEYNGFKIVVAEETLCNESLQALYQRIVAKNLKQGSGSYQSLDIMQTYLKTILERTALKRPLKIVVDCGHGIAGAIAPTLFKQLGCEVIELFCEVDGEFPAHHPDPSRVENLETLIETVKSQHADLGIAFDGDGDRLGVVSANGEIIWPDRLMILFVKDVLAHHSNAQIVFDVKCTQHLAKAIEKQGGKALMWKTGHSLIKAKMRETGALLAGEMSGHLYFADRWYGFDDALYAAVRLLEILSQAPIGEDIFANLPNSINTPELNVSVVEGKNFSIIDALQKQSQFPNAEIKTIDGLRVEYADGWGLVRASNTTPSLVLRFEAENQAALERIQNTFRQELLNVDSTLQLPF